MNIGTTRDQKFETFCAPVKKVKKCFAIFARLLLVLVIKTQFYFEVQCLLYYLNVKYRDRRVYVTSFSVFLTEATVNIGLKNVLRNRTLTQIIVTTI